MTLTNYWWLLIWLALAGGLLAVAVPKKPVQVLGKTEYRWSWGAALVLVCPYVIWAANRVNFGDTEVYRKTFRDIPTLGGALTSYLSEHGKDQGFTVLVSVIKTLIGSNDKLFFFLIAAFQMFCIIYFLRKYSTRFLLSVFMFVISTDYLSWMFNGMRQFIAVCIVLLSFGLVLRKKYIPAVLVILLASTIHASALIMIPLIFVIQGHSWNWKMLLLLVGVGAAILLIDPFTSFVDSILAETQYNDIITNDIWKTDNGTNALRALFYSIPAILSLIGKRFVDRENSPIVNLCVNCSVCTAALYILSVFSSGIYIGRLPIYTTLQGYVAVPWLIEHMFTKQSAKIITGGLICGYLAFFFYQMYFAWNIL